MLRDARAADRAAVFALTRKTWGNYGDFVHRIWGEWIRDRGGRFITAELDGRPVGIAKVTDYGGGEFWLEGLRVAPGERGKGIARAINEEIQATLAAMKPRAVRYATGYQNWASRHIGTSFGFKIGGRFRYYWAKARKGRIRGEYATTSDADEIYEFMIGSRFLRLSQGLAGEGWIFRELTRKRLADYIKAKSVIVLRRKGCLAGVAVYAFDIHDPELSMGFVDGDPAAIRALTRNCPLVAGARGVKSCTLSVPTRYFPKLIESAGFKRKNSMGQLVFEMIDPRALSARSGRRRHRSVHGGLGRAARS